jgi:aerobic-type carbon monoxide dehydrogenase small subunit (CoxS/CutS family)
MEVPIKFKVNGVEKSLKTEEKRKLLEVLREDLNLTGAKYGCGEGQCRACLVLVNGKPSMSCLLSVSSVNGKSIVTVEGLAGEGELHPVQQAFLDEEAMQCGYCTSGMILSAVALLKDNPDPTDEEIVKGMNGNICRCNGYPKILNAVRRAGKIMKEGKNV